MTDDEYEQFESFQQELRDSRPKMTIRYFLNYFEYICSVNFSIDIDKLTGREIEYLQDCLTSDENLTYGVVSTVIFKQKNALGHSFRVDGRLRSNIRDFVLFS